MYLGMKSTPDERCMLTLLDLRLHALDLVNECCKLPGFRLGFSFLGDYNVMEWNTIKFRQALGITMIADNQRNVAGQLAALMTMQ